MKKVRNLLTWFSQDSFSFEIGFSREKEFTFLNRESLHPASNSQAPFAFVLDFLMAENQQPEHTATMEEVKLPQLQQLQKLRRKQYQRLVVQFP